jgi:hypothetical protein
MPRSVRVTDKVSDPCNGNTHHTAGNCRNLDGGASVSRGVGSGTAIAMGPQMGDDRRQPPDRTAPMSRFDDETRIRPAETSDGTRMLPPVSDEPDGQPRWAARAAVPPPGAGPAIGYQDFEEPVPPPDDRNWLKPLLFGFIGLVLLGALLTGVWLIFTADDEPPAPDASAPPTATAAPTVATTAPPAATSAPPTTAEPETVKVPDDLVGIDEAQARQKLADAGLRVQVTRREDATMAPGTVIEVQPEPGSDVEPNSIVRIVVASAPKPSASLSQDNDGDG